MKILKSEHKLCLSCMEEHEVAVVEVNESNIFKGEQVDFLGIYEYCSNTDAYSETEEMINSNSLNFKDAYRRKRNLLTCQEIKAIRDKYGLSQKDFSRILDWGLSTITRYENHQVQDRAHDDILRKINSDPNWFLELLERGKDNLSPKAYLNYCRQARENFSVQGNQYLIYSIYALYADFDDEEITGGLQLNLNKVVDLINYLAEKVEELHKVKLMKMLWYIDILNYKRTGRSMTGLIYTALPMGVVPIGHEQIVLLEGVSFDAVYSGENAGYKFRPTKGYKIKELTNEETMLADEIVEKFGKLPADEIIDSIYDEEATVSNRFFSRQRY